MSRRLLAGLLLHGRFALGLVQFQASAELGSLASRSSSALAVFSKVGLDMTYGLQPAEFAAVMESSWDSEARADALAPGANETHEARCQNARPGSMCYHATEWLLAKGLVKHPSWYPSLSEGSLMLEVQSVLHKLGKAFCPRPCQARVAKPLALPPDDRVLEVDGSGRQVLSDAYSLGQPTECGEAEEGDWCYLAIVWLKNIGLQRHPTWYPTLSRESGMQKFQTVLHGQGRVGCPLPCEPAAAEPAAATEVAQAVVSPAAARVDEELEECEDAQDGSRCYVAVRHVLDVGIWTHPEEYPELATDCTFAEAQEHLHLRRQHGCGRPCPQRTTAGGRRLRGRRVRKSPKDMTEREMVEFLNHEWDGYVDADEYVDAAVAGKQNAFEEYTNAVTADGALGPGRSAEGARAAAEAGAEGECRDASPSELCHKAVTWARTVGIFERPKWYAGLSGSSSFQEFQAHLHKERGGLCPMPCLNGAGAPHAVDGDARTREANSTTGDTAPQPGAAAEEGATGGAPEAQAGAQSEGDAVAANVTATGPAPGEPEALPLLDADGQAPGPEQPAADAQPPPLAEATPAAAAVAGVSEEPLPLLAEDAGPAPQQELDGGGRAPGPEEEPAARARQPPPQPAPAPPAAEAEAGALQPPQPAPAEALPLLDAAGRAPGPEQPAADARPPPLAEATPAAAAGAAAAAEAGVSEEPLPRLAEDAGPAPQQEQEAATAEANSGAA